MGARNTCKAIILKENKILLAKKKNSLGDGCFGIPNGTVYYDLPGGGQNKYETLDECMTRECLEELGYNVHIVKLAAIYEEISTNEQFVRDYPQYAHKMHFIFVCNLREKVLEPSLEDDLDMFGSEWVDIKDFDKICLYPEIIGTSLDFILNSNNIVRLPSKHFD